MFWFLTILVAMANGEPAVWPAFLGAGARPGATQSLPLEWTATENITWRATLPGHGQSSPVVWGERVFVTGVEGPNKETYHTVCIDLKSGEELWRRSIENSAPVANSYYVSRAAPTPVVDQDRVIAFFESGDCVAYSHTGDMLWKRSLVDELGDVEAEFGIGASPCQTATTMFVLIEHDGPSGLLAIDKATGKTEWKVDRESRRSWSSPAVIHVDGATQIVVSSAGSVDGYDPESGDVLWSFTDVGGNTGTSPIDYGNGRVLIGASPGRNGENAGSAADSNCLLQIARQGDGWTVKREWIAEGAVPSWASPIVHEGLAYWINRAGVVHCFDAQTGESVYSKRTKQSCWATPIGIGDRIYLFGQHGIVSVLAAGRKFEVLAENESWTDETLPAEPLLAEEESPERRRGVAMFSKPTLYGAAVVEDSIVLRVGNCLICVRPSDAG
ncbi:PQQ-binding-like beta-propeller repeat protein [Rosistilla oblonga]|uniref:outer membrane protein assembly factor BamB family protein n=1 Tax=Rosistilla oblonga TaxID=2527990 RepID=UPI003A97E264